MIQGAILDHKKVIGNEKLDCTRYGVYSEEDKGGVDQYDIVARNIYQALVGKSTVTCAVPF